MGRFELIALAVERKIGGREEPVRSAAGSRSLVALQIEQTVIWTEARRISVSGELDLAGADVLRRLLSETIGSGLSCIVLDLSTCEFLDAGALGVISGLRLKLAANGQELVVQGATGQVERLIALARAISRQACIDETR
ncbi:MAG: STAS domain-containing protein [Solirubrobacterales bacterium]